MFIPVRLPSNAFDLTRSAREVTPPLARVTASDRGENRAEARAPSFPPGLRDVGGELDELLTRLARSPDRSSRAELAVERLRPESASSVRTNGRINSADTSYAKVALGFAGGSSQATLGGVFTGGGMTAQATSLRFVIDADATLGENPSALSFHVTDQNGDTLYGFSGNVRAGQAIELGGDIGLSITFGEGTLANSQSSATAVWQNRPTYVDPYAVFGDADLNLRPRFEQGQQVTAGSFTINGKSIEVTAEDSIASVLRRIEETAPEISATFKDDIITLTTVTNTRKRIEIGNDSSGFLAATKLADGPSSQGFVRPEAERFVESEQFSRVRAGSFRFGGKLIEVDPQSDSLAGVLERMNAAVAGASVYVDKVQRRVVVHASDGADVTLSDDSSGLLGALGLDGAAEAPARDNFTLSPGEAARLERGMADWQAQLVDKTVDDIAAGAEEAAAAAEARAAARGAAAKAQAAYGRESVGRGGQAGNEDRAEDRKVDRKVDRKEDRKVDLGEAWRSFAAEPAFTSAFTGPPSARSRGGGGAGRSAPVTPRSMATDRPIAREA